MRSGAHRHHPVRGLDVGGLQLSSDFNDLLCDEQKAWPEQVDKARAVRQLQDTLRVPPARRRRTPTTSRTALQKLCVSPVSRTASRLLPANLSVGANVVPRKAHDLRHFLLNVIFVSLLDFLTNACPHADPVSDHEPRQLVAVDQDDPLRSWRHAVSCSSREYCRDGRCAFSGTGGADSSSFHEHAIDANEFVDNQIVGKYRTSSAGAFFRVLKVPSPDSGTQTADSEALCRKCGSGRIRQLNELIS